MKTWNLCILILHFCKIEEYASSPVKNVKADRRLLAAILGYRKEDTGFINDVLRVHNKYRKIHGCRDLSQCARLRQQAGMYAQKLADQGAREPQNDPNLKSGIGENIYISCGNEVSGEEAVNHWYEEACNYFGNKKSYNDYKHFAQVIWKATYLIGIGRRTSTKSGQKCTYVVTRYRPGAEQGPAESINIPKGNFDPKGICSGNTASGGGTGANIQASAGFSSQSGSSGPSEAGGEPATNAGESMQGRPSGEMTGSHSSESGERAGSPNGESSETGLSNTQPAQSAGELPATGGPGGETSSQPESSQVAGLPSGGQPAGYSTPTGSVGSETSKGGGMTGGNGVTGSNSIPGMTPTSVLGTGDRERATNPENSHISPLIEQHETGSEGSSQGTVGQQVSPAPHCPPCPVNEIQTASFKTYGGAESLPESSNNPSRSNGEGGQSSNTDQPAGSTNSGNPAKPGKPPEQVNPDEPDNPVNSPDRGKPVEQANPADETNSGKPVEQANPVEPENPANPDNPKVSGGTSFGSGKQCPACSCPNKEGSKKPGEPQGSQGSQPQTAEGSIGSPSQGKQGEPSGNAQLSGKEVSQGEPSANSVPTNEVKPSGEGGPEGNVASGSPGGASEGAGVPSGGNEGSQSSLSGGSEGSQGSSAGGTEGSQGSSSGGTEGSQGSSAGGSEGSQGSSAGGSEGSQGSPAGGSEGSQGSPAGGTEGSQGSSAGGSEGSQGSLAGGSEGSQGSPAGGSEGSQGSSAGGSEGSQGSPAGGSEGSQGSSAGGSEGSQGSLSGGTEGSQGSSAGGSEGSQGSLSGGTEGSQGSSAGGSEGSQGGTGTENQSQSAGNSEGTETTQGGGVESAGETGSNGMGGVQGGQAGATQGTSGQGGGSGSIPEGGAFKESLDVFQQSSLEAHNKYRQFHNSPGLTHNSEMSAQATEFAQKLARSSINNTEHSLKSSRIDEGENIYAACGTNPSGADVTKEWYKELCNYNYNKHAEIDAKKPIGHFTQVVWKSSTEFGIGRAYGSKGDNADCIYAVARYKPPGNIIGSESTNIERGAMDAEYCGREFMAINSQENGNKEQQSPGEQPEGNHQSTNTGSSEESNQQNSNTGTSEANVPESSNQASNNNQQTTTITGESSPSETGNANESNQPSVNSEANQATSTSSEGGRQETNTESTNEQSQTSPSTEGDGNKRIKTPFLPGYLQKTALENSNKLYKELRTE